MLLQLIDVVEVGQVGMLDVGIFAVPPLDSVSTQRLKFVRDDDACKGSQT